MRIAFYFLFLISPVIAFTAVDQQAGLFSQSPDGKVVITAEDPDQQVAQFVDTASKHILGKVDGQNTEGPIKVEWRKDSRYVVLAWRGHRYNWYRCLIRLTAQRQPRLIKVDDKRLIEIIRKDTRPVWKREAQTDKGDPDYPFEKKRWLLVPDGWTKEGNLLISAIELARESSDPHPFQQGVQWYGIEAQIDNGGFNPVRLTAGDIDIWKAK